MSDCESCLTTGERWIVRTAAFVCDVIVLVHNPSIFLKLPEDCVGLDGMAWHGIPGRGRSSCGECKRRVSAALRGYRPPSEPPV